jgi:hemin uptake protein HemP
MKNDKNNSNSPHSTNSARAEDISSERRRLSSQTLFGTRNEIVIVHNDDEYRLRITSNGKLILTK